MEDINIASQRMFYVNLREATGCPPIQVTKTPFGHFCIVKGTDFEMNVSDPGSAWNSKALCVAAWREAQGVKDV